LITEQFPVVGVGAIVIRQGKILLVRRKNDPFAGHWAIPGGKQNYGESLKTAAAREVLEETGVVIMVNERYPEVFEFLPTGEFPQHFIIIDFHGEYLSGEPISRDDALSADWVSPEEAENLNLTKSTRTLLKNLKFLP
jgi:ADP-ribose pyrophosphatase